MNDFMKWCLKTLIGAVLWVFILSITWKGQPVFNYANEALVQNAIVRGVDEELDHLWEKLKVATRAAFTGEKHDGSRDERNG
jgi:hypothetical protein